MPKFRIENTQSGHVFGVFEAESADEALNQMHREAGYNPEEVEDDPNIVVEEID